MKKAYVDKLAEALKQHQPRETILVTGSRSEGRRILSVLTAQGHLLVGVRAETPFSLAQELCAPWFSMDGMPRLIGEVEGADLIRGCLNQSTGIYGGVNAKTLTATRSIFRTFQEMALAGVPEDLTKHPALQSSAKLRELQAIRKAYLLQKQARRLLDRADLLGMAVKAASAKNDSPLRRAFYVTLGDYAPAPLERQLLELLAGEDRLTVVDLPCAEGVELPAGTMAEELPRVNAVEAVRNASPRFAACRGAETEVRFVFRDLLADTQLKLEDCAVVYLSGSYAQPLSEEAARFSIPVSMGGGLPMTGSLLYTTLKQVAELPRTNFYAEDVCRQLEAFSLTPVWPVKLAERMRKKKIGWGKARYALVCGDADVAEIRPKDMTDKAWQMLLDNWNRFLTLLVDVAKPTGGLEEQRQDLLAFLPFCNHKSMEEAVAAAKAAELLEQVTELGSDETLLRRLLALMENSAYLGGAVEPGRLYCAPLSQAAFTGRKRLYVLGLSRYAVEGIRKESPILLDREREALGGLKTSVQLGREQEFRLLTLLARHDRELVLTYPDFDSGKMLDQQPAPFFEKASEGFPVERVSYIPLDCRTAMDCMAAKEALQNIPAAKPWTLQDGKKAALQAKKSIKELLQEMELSPTGLETALKCPYKFYLQYLMRIRTPQPVEWNPQAWLTGKEIGDFCHSVLEHTYTPGQSAGWEEIFEQEFQTLEKQIPLPHPRLKQETKYTLKGIVERAVAWTEGSGRTVAAAERKFDNLSMTFGGWTLRIRGSIDRVDDLGNDELAILDYKTGKPEAYTEELHRHWQHYLYTRAEEQLEQKSIAQAGYLFLKEGADLVTLAEDDDLRQETEARIAWLLDRISAEDYTPECWPCFVPETVPEGCPPPKPRLLEPSGSKDALKQCANGCEFAAICPAQGKKGGR